MSKIKLLNVEPLINLLDPLLMEKCGGLLSWEIIDLLNDLKPHLEKINQVREKIKEDYGQKDDNGQFLTKKNDQGLELIVFGDNLETVEKELQELMDQEIEISKSIQLKNFGNEVKIEPIKIKVLDDLGLLVK